MQVRVVLFDSFGPSRVPFDWILSHLRNRIDFYQTGVASS
jgi:hypothetical protein